MLTSCFRALTLLSLVLAFASVAKAQLVPFRDSAQGLWGYKLPDGPVALSPIYIGAGEFRDGRAPIEDSEGFGVINDEGAVVNRISRESLPADLERVSPPSDECAWSDSEPFPSTGLQCYIAQLRGSEPVIGGRIVRVPPRAEGGSSAVSLRLQIGAVVMEEIRYESVRRRLLLPGINAADAFRWRQLLYPDRPRKIGCSESWTSGQIQGGAFIEQSWGC